jgi:hypothetical protein
MGGQIMDTGPIDYLVIEFPAGPMSGQGLPLLLELVDRDLIRILDLVVVRREEDGSVAGLNLADLDGDGALEFAAFRGASSGLLDRGDIEEAGRVLAPGATAVVLVYENVWAAPLAGALRRDGAQLVAGGRIPVDAVLASLEAAEQSAVRT